MHMCILLACVLHCYMQGCVSELLLNAAIPPSLPEVENAISKGGGSLCYFLSGLLSWIQVS